MTRFHRLRPRAAEPNSPVRQFINPLIRRPFSAPRSFVLDRPVACAMRPTARRFYRRSTGMPANAQSTRATAVLSDTFRLRRSVHINLPTRRFINPPFIFRRRARSSLTAPLPARCVPQRAGFIGDQQACPQTPNPRGLQRCYPIHSAYARAYIGPPGSPVDSLAGRQILMLFSYRRSSAPRPPSDVAGSASVCRSGSWQSRRRLRLADWRPRS